MTQTEPENSNIRHTEREQEIKEKYDRTLGNVTGQMVLTHKQVSFLLSTFQQLREERDKYHKLASELATEQRYAKEQAIYWNDETVKLRQENERLKEEIVSLRGKAHLSCPACHDDCQG